MDKLDNLYKSIREILIIIYEEAEFSKEEKDELINKSLAIWLTRSIVASTDKLSKSEQKYLLNEFNKISSSNNSQDVFQFIMTNIDQNNFVDAIFKEGETVVTSLLDSFNKNASHNNCFKLQSRIADIFEKSKLKIINH